MSEEILDQHVQESNLKLPFNQSYIAGAFKVWKITFYLSIILSVIASGLLIYMEFVYYPNNRPDFSSTDYFSWYDSPEYRSFSETYEMFQGTAIILYLGSGISLILNMIFHLIVLYKHWNIIQGVRQVSTTPGAAVGFLFIPFYNLYWVFIAFYKLSVDQERFAQQNGVILEKQAYKGLALAAVICRLIPYVGLLTFFILGPIRIYNQQKISLQFIRELGE